MEGKVLTPGPAGKSMWSAAAAAKSLQSCPTLCDPIDGSPPGSPKSAREVKIDLPELSHYSMYPRPKWSSEETQVMTSERDQTFEQRNKGKICTL